MWVLELYCFDILKAVYKTWPLFFRGENIHLNDTKFLGGLKYAGFI